MLRGIRVAHCPDNDPYSKHMYVSDVRYSNNGRIMLPCQAGRPRNPVAMAAANIVPISATATDMVGTGTQPGRPNVWTEHASESSWAVDWPTGGSYEGVILSHWTSVVSLDGDCIVVLVKARCRWGRTGTLYTLQNQDEARSHDR
jgi:hypothetical protein